MSNAPAPPADIAGLFRRHGTRLYQYCASRIGATAAEDVVADTFLIAYEQRHRIRPGPGVPAHDTGLPWLYGIATNLLRRHRRAEVRALRALARTGVDPLVEPGLAEGAAARVDASAQVRRIAHALAALPTRQRDVLLLFAIGELEYGEIADAMGIPLGSVQSALHRARTKIRAELTSTEDRR